MITESTDNASGNQVAPFSVTQATQIYTESLRTNLSKVEMIVSGFYKDSKRRDYNGIYYDYLLDIDNRSSLTIKIPERIKINLTAWLILGLSRKIPGDENYFPTISYFFNMTVFVILYMYVQFEQNSRLLYLVYFANLLLMIFLFDKFLNGEWVG